MSTSPIPSLSTPGVERTVKEFDLAVSALVALAVMLLGRSIVAYEVFTGRPLPRDRFFSQWRNTVLVAGGFGLVASWTLAIDLRPVYSLMLATALMTFFYALSSWRAFAEREAFMAPPEPFLASQNLYGILTAFWPPRVGCIGRRLRPAACSPSLCRDPAHNVQAARAGPSSGRLAGAGQPAAH